MQPVSVCPGDTIQVKYEAAVAQCLLPPSIGFDLFVSGTGNDGGAFSQGGISIGNDTKRSQTKSIQLSKTLQPNDYFLEASIGPSFSTEMRSKRLPLTVGGKGITAQLTIQGPILLQNSPYPAKLSVPAGAAFRVLSGATEIAVGTGPASGDISVPFTQAGSKTIIVEVMAPDLCLVQRAFTFDVLTCSPKLEAGTELSSALPVAPSVDNLWVCGGTTYESTSRHVYVESQGMFGGKASSKAVAWVQPGGSLGPKMTGSWTILHVGNPPAVPAGVQATFGSCPSITFDSSSVASKCP